jgi:cytochrome c553
VVVVQYALMMLMRVPLTANRAALRPSIKAAIACATFALSGPQHLNAQSRNRSASVPNVAIEVPSWAFPLPAPGPGAKVDSVTRLHLPGSKRSFTDLQLRDRFNVADWYPGTHAPMPKIVAHGREPAIIACGLCHLPDGSGRPENAMLAGLPEAYIRQQLADIKSRGRESAFHGKNGPIDLMRGIADSLTRAEITEAARYFSRLKARQRSQVVEAVNIPRTKPSSGLYFKDPDGGEEPLGRRLIEMPVEAARHELRDAHTEYVAYVPVGSIARGRQLATQGKTACTLCHGPDLRGVGVIPPLAGRSPSYLLRELLAFRSRARFTVAGRPMRDVVAPLTIDDMIAAAAYAGSRKP